MATDQEIETEIQSKGLTAPRLTQYHIEAAIAAQYYIQPKLNGAGAIAGWHVAPDFEVPKAIESIECLTICILVLRNGFTVVGKSACASPANFDVELGREIARQDAVSQVWALEGYLLKQKLATA